MQKLKYILPLFILLISTTLHSKELEIDTLWNKANDYYSIGNFEQAINAYSEIENNGYVSAKLYYNLGNAYYRTGNVGKSVLYYERALKLDPSNPDFKANLQMAQTRCIDKIESVPEFMIVSWIKKVRDSLSSNGWSIMAIIFLIITAISFIIFSRATSVSTKKTLFFSAIVAIFIAIISFIFSYSLYSRVNIQDSAVVSSAVCNVKSAPNAGGNSIFVLHTGTKVNVKESIGDWSKIEIRDGRQGWIKSDDIDLI